MGMHTGPHLPGQELGMLSAAYTSVLCTGLRYEVMRASPGAGMQRVPQYGDLASLLVWGQGQTQEGGEVAIALTDSQKERFLYVARCGKSKCWGGDAAILGESVVFVATARSDRPVLLTWTQEQKPLEGEPWCSGPLLGREFDKWRGEAGFRDITLTVRSWNLDGTPAPWVSFGWFCIGQGAGIEPCV